jgi:hypothetical protein
VSSDGSVSLDRPPAQLSDLVSAARIEVGCDGPLAFPAPAGFRRGHVPRETWTALDAFVVRTYVPNTASSRNAGAGSGLTDGD